MEEHPLVLKTRAHGKLLLTGEYFVLDGAWALALPLRFGQTLQVATCEPIGRLIWSSTDELGDEWFRAVYSLPTLAIQTATDPGIARTLAAILQACQRQNPAFLNKNQGFQASIQHDFPRAWGLGTSSTLIAALARWAAVNPYPVLFSTLGGSGYDLACAYATGPLLYQLAEQGPQVKEIRFEPDFKEQLFFVYLGKKQDSRMGIERYRAQVRSNPVLLNRVSYLTECFVNALDLFALEKVILEHEILIGQALDLPRAKTIWFADYWGEIKSLGAWGGDFVLASSNRSEALTKAYFQQRGFDMIFGWTEMTQRTG